MRLRLRYLFLFVMLTLLLVAPSLAFSGVTNTGTDVDNLTVLATGTGGEVLNYYDVDGPVVLNQADEGYVVTYFAIELDPGQTGNTIFT